MKPDFSKMDGLVPAVVQDSATLEVLMVGFMNEEAFEQTLKDKRVTFWSRSRKRLWQKGETSQSFLDVMDVKLDCDEDTVLVLVRPAGPTCHTGERSCFGQSSRRIGFLGALDRVIRDRQKKMPEGSYTTSLFKDGLEQILAKVEEESEEVVRAAREETLERLTEESGDLLYHWLVLLVEKKVSLEDVMKILEERHKE
ncbi:MAG: bifunctional phosphoribosyl-AMP cyclohydrolase/phosphoribosyl-ATP diphosphatase HisIE [Candidatus Peregrinibacteria bacterium]|nr:bifunctional phosphoribosyl-AMP cyclohydrolase/phosphoribosyl-ATP diphosphatase HisIE [Candidatus Peregrinibacteria bacterium]